MTNKTNRTADQYIAETTTMTTATIEDLAMSFLKSVGRNATEEELRAMIEMCE